MGRLGRRRLAAGWVVVLLGLTGALAGAGGAAAAPGAARAPGGALVTWGAVPGGYPASALADERVIAVAGGPYHALVVTDQGRIVGWGSDVYGQATAPASLAGKRVTAVAVGVNHSLALTSGGQVVGWGADYLGQATVPASLAGKTVTAIAAGSYHNLALTSQGEVVAWGDNQSGQTSVPASLAGKKVTAIAAGPADSLALTSGGQVVAWGDNQSGQTSVPASLAGKKVTAIAAGGTFSLALTSDGRIVGWGNDAFGQSTEPASLAGKTVTAIAAGFFHSLALTSPGKVVGWGSGAGDALKPPASLAGQTILSIAAGSSYSMAIVEPLAPVVSTSPASQTVIVGSQVTFTAEASGLPKPATQWQVSTDRGPVWTDIGGATSGSLTFTAAAEDHGHRYRAVFTNVAGSVATPPATLTVELPPTVTVDPRDLRAPRGQPATFTARAAGRPTPAVRWERSIDGGGSWFAITGETSSTYRLPSTAQSDDQDLFRAVFTNPAGSATSGVARLTVLPPDDGGLTELVSAVASWILHLVGVGQP